MPEHPGLPDRHRAERNQLALAPVTVDIDLDEHLTDTDNGAVLVGDDDVRQHGLMMAHRQPAGRTLSSCRSGLR